MAAYEVLLLNTAIPQIQAAQSGDTYVVPRDMAVNANLNVTGNTTLGNASTDTVQVNGYMGVGGAGSANKGIYQRNTALTGTSQYGITAEGTFNSAATSGGVGIASSFATEAAAFTMTNAINFRAFNITLGAGSAITNQYGLLVDDQTRGTNNFGVASSVSSGTNKWNIYASGTANNAFAGNVRIGSTTAPTNALDVTGAMTVSGNTTLGDASTDTVTVNGYMAVGNNTPNADTSLFVRGNALTGTAQAGVWGSVIGTSEATVRITGVAANPQTAAASFTCADVIGFRSVNATKGAGSTITNQHGLYIDDQTNGTNNFGITSLVSSGTNKWNIYASGTAANYFAGNVLVGAIPATTYGRLQVIGNTGNAIGIAISDSVTDATNKNGRLKTYHYTSAEEPVTIVIAISNSTDNTLSFGGGSTVENAATQLAFYTAANNTTLGGTERLRITSAGNVSIGGTADRATTVGSAALNIFNGTAPVGTLSNGISIYSSSGEAYVMDAAGNATLFSPHDAVTNEWIFRSKHTPTGKVLKIDVERLLKFVNDHFGLDAVHEFIED